jgi:hypothetical protein
MEERGHDVKAESPDVEPPPPPRRPSGLIAEIEAGSKAVAEVPAKRANWRRGTELRRRMDQCATYSSGLQTKG